LQLSIESCVLDTIREDELVTSRVISTSPTHVGRPADPVKETPHSQSYPSTRRCIAEPNEPSRIQIHLVSAELARRHAAVTLKHGTTAINGILAFEGEFISGNTSLVTIQYRYVAALAVLMPHF
jgi:hypothetical protein